MGKQSPKKKHDRIRGGSSRKPRLVMATKRSFLPNMSFITTIVIPVRWIKGEPLLPNQQITVSPGVSWTLERWRRARLSSARAATQRGNTMGLLQRAQVPWRPGRKRLPTPSPCRIISTLNLEQQVFLIYFPILSHPSRCPGTYSVEAAAVKVVHLRNYASTAHVLLYTRGRAIRGKRWCLPRGSSRLSPKLCAR